VVALKACAVVLALLVAFSVLSVIAEIVFLHGVIVPP
jgi:hypothetical protein